MIPLVSKSMQKTVLNAGVKSTLHVGIENESVCITLIATNTTDETITASSGMGTWAWIGLTDENDMNRLESMGSTAAVTGWSIDPSKSLVSTRSTESCKKAKERWSEIPSLPEDDLVTPQEFMTLSEKEQEEAYQIPALDVDSGNSTEFKASGQVDLGDYGASLEVTFTLADLGESFDMDSVDIMNNPRDNWKL